VSTISLNSIYHKWYKTLSGILYMYCICCHSFVCVVFSSKSEARSVKVFIWFVYICIVAGDPFIKRVDWNPSDLFNPISFLCQSHDRTWMTGGYFYYRPPPDTTDLPKIAFIYEYAFLNPTIYRRPLPAAWIKVEMDISLF
jgi:hypothetical protein